MRERGFVLQPVRVVARGDEQDRGGVAADAVDLEQAWSTATHQHFKRIVKTLAVSVERENATSQRRDRELRRVDDGVAPDSRTQRRRGHCQLVSRNGPESFA